MTGLKWTRIWRNKETLQIFSQKMTKIIIWSQLLIRCIKRLYKISHKIRFVKQIYFHVCVLPQVLGNSTSLGYSYARMKTNFVSLFCVHNMPCQCTRVVDNSTSLGYSYARVKIQNVSLLCVHWMPCQCTQEVDNGTSLGYSYARMKTGFVSLLCVLRMPC